VIAIPGSVVAARAAKAATATTPIVFQIGDDPVQAGLVASLGRPGGNITGVTSLNVEVTSKRLRLLHELVPKAARVAVLVNPANTTATESALRDLHEAAPIIGLQIQVLKATTIAEIDAAFAMLAREGPDALFVGPTDSSPPGVCNLPSWPRAKGYRRLTRSGAMSQPAG
jgi:putative ABC transport system substrate-binding protein